MAIFLKIGFGLLVSKVLAIYVGPSGMALVGNLRNFQTSLESFSTLGFQNGIIKYVAQFKKDEPKLKKLISTVIICILVVMLLLGIGLIVLKRFILNSLFTNQTDYETLFKVIIISLPFYGLSLFLTSLINGFGKYKKVVTISIITNIIGFLLSIFLVINYQIIGALLTMIITPTITFLVAFLYVIKEIKLFRFISIKAFDKGVLSDLSSYSAMALFSATIGPLLFIFLRNHLTTTAGIEIAGYWESMNRISTYYLLFVSSLMSMYFLPQLANSNSEETKLIFKEYFKTIVPVFFIGIIIIYFCRNLIISLLFTSDFQPVSDLFFWQLIGDFFKVCSWILAIHFLAKKQTSAYFATEIFSFTVFLISGYVAILYFDAIGIVFAHALTHFLYLILLLTLFRKQLIE